MRVCHFVFNIFPSTTEVFEYSYHLRQLGIDAEVVALALREEEPLTDCYRGVPVRRILVGKRGRSLATKGRSLAALQQVIPEFTRIIKAQHYDLIHVYAFQGAAYLRLRCRRHSVRWLYDIRTGNLRYGWLGWLGNRRLTLESLFFDHVAVLDPQVGRRVLGNRPFSELPLGADFKRFVPGDNPGLRASLGYSDQDLVAVYVGTMVATRDLSRLIQGFAIAASQIPQLRLLMVGDGDRRPQLESLAAELGLMNRVQFTGRRPHTEVPDYIAAADIGLAYVPKTPFFDVQPPLKTVEMLAAGKAVLATNTRGNMRFIQSGDNGLLVEDMPETIAAGFCALADPQLRQRFQAVARASVEQYDWSVIVHRYLIPLYNEMLKAR